MAFLPRKPWLPESFTGIQEGIIPNCRASYLQHDLHPESTANYCVPKQKSNQPFWKYIFSDLRVDFWQRKSGSMSRPANLEQKEIVWQNLRFIVFEKLGLPGCGCTRQSSLRLSNCDGHRGHVGNGINATGSKADGTRWMEDRFRGSSRRGHVDDHGHG